MSVDRLFEETGFPVCFDCAVTMEILPHCEILLVVGISYLEKCDRFIVICIKNS